MILEKVIAFIRYIVFLFVLVFFCAGIDCVFNNTKKIDHCNKVKYIDEK